MRASFWRVVAAAMLATATVSPASAAERPAARADDDEAAAKAREHLARAATAYKVRDFDEAVKEFRAAYKLKPTPALLFNIGQAERQRGNLKEARFYYETFLHDVPDAPNAEEVRSQIRQIDALLAAQERDAKPAPVAAATPAPTTPTPTPEPAAAPAASPAPSPGAPVALQPPAADRAAPSGTAVAPPKRSSPPAPAQAGRGWLSWTLIGTGAVATVAGGWLYADAWRTHSAWEADRAARTFTVTAEQARSAQALAPVGLAVGGVGLALVAGGLVLPAVAPRVALQVVPTPGAVHAFVTAPLP